ncbi:Transposon Ty3-I Gag-Pol polyprotein [Vitis vinifera]|uniref:Transposon Ty3-I Gag-Pol polyprotein n=1 Tax=Vitis vinifera TaxID=29760 RepID=A0A438E124_VITVI|nr:Transposon Ty3-I Gag-Pol polyprotein [Vitis vinifera]
MSFMTFYFSDEIDEHGTFAEIEDIVDEVVPHEEYIDEMLAMNDDSSSASDSYLIDQRVSPAVGTGRVLRVTGQCHPCSQKDSKVRVCVDFQNLNKVSPKDDFPLPHIDMLVDSTIGHSMLFFMGGYSRYSQILMALEDMEKTSFVTKWDDMIMKSRDRSDHLAALERFFERIRQFRLRPHPKKCTFGVTYGKLLGYMVSERGIEANPYKIRAILDMLAPRTKRKIRDFLCRLQYISRFIARLIAIYLPIFRLLRKSQPTVWDDQCQRAFERTREYLLSSPVLVPPSPGRLLLLYLSVSDVALGCMLAQLDDSGKK